MDEEKIATCAYTSDFQYFILFHYAYDEFIKGIQQNDSYKNLVRQLKGTSSDGRSHEHEFGNQTRFREVCCFSRFKK